MYNTFVINTIDGAKASPPELDLKVLDEIKHRQLNSFSKGTQTSQGAFQHAKQQISDKDKFQDPNNSPNQMVLIDNALDKQKMINIDNEDNDEYLYNENNDNSAQTKNIIYHPDGYIIVTYYTQNVKTQSLTIPDKLLLYFPNLMEDVIARHWFVSRESYSTLFSHSHREKHYKTHSKRQHLTYFSKTKVQTPTGKGFNNTQTTSYFNIEKSASSTTTTYLQRQSGEYKFEQNIIDSNTLVISNCSFTFVRDPLQRFVSAYYTVNRLMWDVENHPERVQDHEHIATLRHLFKFLSVEGEPERFRAFVDDLSIESLFIFGSRHLQHMMSQSAILSLQIYHSWEEY